MNERDKKSKIDKVAETAAPYDVSKMKRQGIDLATFDFDAEFKKGYTPEEFKAEMYKRIQAYPWKK